MKHQTTSTRSQASRRSLLCSSLVFGALTLLAGLAEPAIAAPAPAACTNSSASAVNTNTLWECVLKVKAYGAGLPGRSPYLTRLKVKFTLGTDPPRSTYAFWDGMEGAYYRFVFRMTFPWSGPTAQTWTWSTACEPGDMIYCPEGKTDPSLLASGSVLVSNSPAPAPTAAPSLAFLGPISAMKTQWSQVGYGYREWWRLNQKNRPFVWVGDSAWAAPLFATDAEWTSYLNSRTYQVQIAQGIKTENRVSVIHVGIAPNWDCEPPAQPTCTQQPADRQGQRPFTSTITTGVLPNSGSTPNVPFWRSFENKIKAANDKGFYVLVSGVMEPVVAHSGGYPSSDYPANEEAVNFVRWLTARLSGCFVLLSPGFDSNVIARTYGGNQTTLQSLVGAEIKRVAPHVLVTNHWNTNQISEIATLHASSWLDFEMFQSGFSSGDTTAINSRAREMSQQISGSNSASTVFNTTKKVALNGEAIYDEGGGPGGTSVFNDYWARQAGYLSFLSGAAAYSFGVGGSWDWGRFASTMHPSYGAGSYDDFHPVLDQMKHMRTFVKTYLTSFFNAYEQSRILNQPTNEYKMALVREATNGILAYMPNNERIKIDITGTAVNVATGKLWDPKFGTYAMVSSGTDPNYSCVATVCEWRNRGWVQDAPRSSDRVLVLSSVPSSMWSLSDSRNLEVMAGRFAEADPIGIHALLLDATGQPTGTQAVISNVIGEEPGRPAAARDGKGGFLVVWQTDSDFDGLEEIWGRPYAINAKASPSFRISPADDRDHSEPAVGLTPNGQAVVTWTMKGQDLETSQIKARAWSATAGLGNTIALCSGEGVECSSSKAAASLTGAFSISWLEHHHSLEQERVMIQRFSAGLISMEEPQQVNSVDAGVFWLRHLHVDNAGTVRVEYESRLGPLEGAVFAQDFDATGSKAGSETLLVPPYVEE